MQKEGIRVYYDLLSNVINVLFLSCTVILVDLFLDKKYSQYVVGVIFGLITIFVMIGHIVVEGRFYDFRLITMTMAGFIGGPVTAVIAALISSLYRYCAGGTGSMAGITNIITFACFGSILGKHLRRSNQNGKKLLFWFMIGIIMTCILFLLVVFNTLWISDPIAILKVVAAPFLIITPLATTIIFNFYFWTYNFLGKSTILNTILNNSPVNLIIFDDHGPILCSKNSKQLQTNLDIDNPTQLLDPDKSWLNTANPLRKEIITENGRHLVADLSRFQKPKGEYACIAIVNDVTDQNREQEQFRVATDRFAKAFKLGPHMMAIIRKSDYRYLDVNHRFLEERSFTREDVIGKTPIEMGIPESEFKQILETIELHGSVQNVECSLVTKYGSIGTAILSADMINIDDQECILLAYNDVTEIKRMQTEKVEQLSKYLSLEAELSQSNQLIADIVNHMPDGFYSLDNQWRFTFVNAKAAELFSKTREELLGKVIWNIIPHFKGTLLEENYQKAQKDYEAITFEYLSLIQKDTWYQVTVYPSQFGLTVYYRDVTERKIARDKLIESQKQMSSILESMTDCFFAVDENWEFTYINHAGEIAFGKSRNELLSKKITEAFNVNVNALSHYHKVMSEKRSANFQILSEALGNKWLEVSVYPSVNGFTCYFRDISSLKIAQDEMARLDRLHLVGQLAAGIGHEIRNPMTTVRGYLQLLGEKPDCAVRKPTFELMISELDRANSIITEFLSLAQTKQSNLKFQDLNDILNNLYPLLEADTFTQNKQIRFIPGEIPYLKLNEKQISQLVLNLVRNGLEAMKENGSLTIKSYSQGGLVMLEITDEGCGIPPENIIKVGTPFFTTKDSGTGLGLATCYKIAESHNAKIHIDSNPSGTTFFIRFPIPDQESEQNVKSA